MLTGSGHPVPDFCHPSRPPRRKDLPKAIHHFRKLLRDKDDTDEVFGLYDAWPSRHFVPRAKAFTESPLGQRLFRDEHSLTDYLDDHRSLRLLPKGSVGQAYADFMESEDLSAKELAKASQRGGLHDFEDLMSWYARRERDTHDLLHVITGYGRDVLGEQCVLLFTHGHAPNAVHLLLAYGGGFALRRQSPTRIPLWRALGEARRAGRRSPSVAEMPVREVLRTDLGVLRDAMRLRRPEWYHACHDVWRAAGVDPNTVMRV